MTLTPITLLMISQETSEDSTAGEQAIPQRAVEDSEAQSASDSVNVDRKSEPVKEPPIFPDTKPRHASTPPP